MLSWTHSRGLTWWAWAQHWRSLSSGDTRSQAGPEVGIQEKFIQVEVDFEWAESDTPGHRSQQQLDRGSEPSGTGLGDDVAPELPGCWGVDEEPE